MKYNAIKKADKAVYNILKAENGRQEEELQLIASENYTSLAVMEAQGSVMTNKYAEGYPGRRYYQGMKHYDEVETLAIERAKKLFNAEHANVQPSSGSQANMAATLAVVEPGDTIMGMDLACGGHLTHGMRLNYSGMYFKVASYPVRKEDFRIDYDVGSTRGPRGRTVDVLSLASRSEALGEPVTVHLTILDHDDLRGALKPDARGRTERGDLQALERLIASESGAEPDPT